MSKRPTVSPATTSHPPLGTFIDGNALELVEVLGVGGYGVVYRAVDAFNSQRSYAVKCLISAQGQSQTRRQLHLREITLHQIASAHPGVVTLHRVVEDSKHTFIIMDFATDEDLFTQILHKCCYLGNDNLIRHVFLQLIDAVQYCHSLGIHHRDLKPENVLCFDHGYRVAITDFGLATTDKLSKEFRTGSVYHMSPECQSGDSERPIPYSPMHNDVWSLGIILLNLVTGRNPWKSAMSDDPTYQAYQRDPLRFLPSVLPISEELNNLLVQTLDVDWKGRLSLSELRTGIQNMRTFYSDNVIFEGSLARCPWEAGMDLGNGAAQQQQQLPADKRPVPNVPEEVEPYSAFSISDGVSEYKSPASFSDDTREREPWEEDSARYDQRPEEVGMYDDVVHTPYGSSSSRSYTSESSSPATPSSFDTSFNINPGYERTPFREEDSTIYPSSFGETSMADTDDNRFASSVFLATPVMEQKPYFYRPEAAYMDGYRTQKRYSSPNTSVYSVAEESAYDVQSPTSTDFPPTSPNFALWTEPRAVPQTRPIDIQGGGRRSSPQEINKPKSHNIFNPLRFFPRSSGSSWLNQKTPATASYPPASSNPVRMRPASPKMAWNDHRHYHPQRPVANVGKQGHYTSNRGHTSNIRSGRDWIPG